MEREQLYEQIESYLSGDMDGKASRAFEARLEADPELKRQVELHREIAAALADREEIRLENTLREIANGTLGPANAQTEPEPKPPPNLFARFPVARYLAAAGIALLVGVGIWWAISSVLSTPSSQHLYLAYYEPYPAPSYLRDDPGQDLNPRDQAFQTYMKGDYEQATQLFTKLLETGEDLQVRFLLGVSELENGNTEKARNHFWKVIEDGKNLYVTQARWYTALAYLKEEQPGSAEPILEDLAREKGKYADLASKLLSEME